jgi:hypothetical protein
MYHCYEAIIFSNFAKHIIDGIFWATNECICYIFSYASLGFAGILKEL